LDGREVRKDGGIQFRLTNDLLDGRQVRPDGGISSELKVGSGLQKTNWMEDRFSDEGQLY
jgi:hypothetical protein